MTVRVKFFFIITFGFISYAVTGCSPVNFGQIPTSSVGVNNVINTVQPALVTRASGCIMCHANVASNIITDFGYGGDGKGLNYFFGGVPGQTLPSGLTNEQGGSVYGDYDFTTGGDQNWGSAALSPGIKVIVPQASTAGLNILNSADTTLALYLKDMLGQNSSVSGVSVQEVSSLYIGAPTVSRIMAVSGVASGGLRFIPSSKTAPAFSGIALNAAGTFYTNGSQPIVCEGDVAIDGIVWLNQPVIQTVNGCRLYVTQSVFVTGAITYPSGSNNENLQISSAKLVALGLGHNTCNNSAQYSDSINERLVYSSDNRFDGFFTRTLGAPQQMLASLKADADTVGVLSDAICGPVGRTQGYQHLLVNAPVIESRYQGPVDGLIIGELTLLSLEALTYSFDPVFSNVQILPLLDQGDYLTSN